LRNGSAQRALTGRGRTAVTLGRGSARRRGSSGGKPVRQTPARWRTSVRRSSVDGRDERREGEKIRPAGGGSVLKGSGREGARRGGHRVRRSGREREGERGPWAWRGAAWRRGVGVAAARLD
jgi:hypothetical protein